MITKKKINRLNFLEEIQKDINENFIVIVEGIKDKASLELVGFKNIVVWQGKPYYKKIEEIVGLAKKTKTEVIILTDFDKKGKQLYKIIKKELIKEGIKINDKLRKMLLKEKISHVEGLASFVKNNFVENLKIKALND